MLCRPVAPTEFDFDDVGQDPVFTPRRTPGEHFNKVTLLIVDI